MAFASVLTEETQTISLDDLKIIVSLFLCILFAFLNNFHKVNVHSIALLTLSCIANLYAMKIAFYDCKVDVYSVNSKKLDLSNIKFDKGIYNKNCLVFNK